MIFFSIEGHNRLLDSEGLTTLQDAIKAVESFHLPEGYLISRVVADGQEVEPLNGGGWPLLALDQHIEVSVIAEKAAHIAREGMVQTIQLVKDLTEVMQEAARAFRAGENEQGQQGLIEGITALESLVRFLAMSRQYFPEALALFSAFEGGLVPVLDDMMNAQQAQEWEILAGRIEGALLPQFARWEPLCQEIVAAK